MQHTRESRLAWTTTVEPESCYMVKVFSYLMNQDFQSIGPIGDNIVHLYPVLDRIDETCQSGMEWNNQIK